MGKISENENIIYFIDDNSHINEFNRDDIKDMNILVDLLIDELAKESTKQKQWFNKYWEMKKRLNSISDFVGEMND